MTFLATLASARSVDTSGTNLVLILTCLGIVAASAILALVPYRIALGRRARTDALLIAIVVWAVVLDGGAISTAIARSKWKDESEPRLETGFYDPSTADAGKPAWPFGTFAGLTAGYIAIVSWSATSRSREVRT